MHEDQLVWLSEYPSHSPLLGISSAFLMLGLTLYLCHNAMSYNQRKTLEAYFPLPATLEISSPLCMCRTLTASVSAA